jgi:hypothetical protein
MSEDKMKTSEAFILACMTDIAFKQRVIADPISCIKEAGGTIPNGVRVNVLEDTSNLMHLVIPARPNELSDETLESVAGGLSWAEAKERLAGAGAGLAVMIVPGLKGAAEMEYVKQVYQASKY